MTGPFRPSAVETAGAVRAGEVSAASLIEGTLTAISSVQATLNAFTAVHEESALAAAQAIDRTVAAGDDPGPLAGVPIAIKDLIDEAGVPNTLGSSFPPAVPDVDAHVIARLRRAGAVIVGRTGLHEFAFGFSSENEHFGPVRNPWDTATSPGGSSGGSGAVVGAGIVPAALGTDTGGSVRVPAALCGAVGLKVTHGRVSTAGVAPLAPSIDTVGPIARTVADIALVYGAIAGFDPVDPWSRERPVLLPREAGVEASVRLAVPHPWVDRPMSDDVAAAWEWFLASARDGGIEIVELELPALDFPGKMLESVYPEVAEVHRERFTAHPERYGREVARRVEAALGYTMRDYLDGLAWRGTIGDAFETALQACDAVVTPTVAAMRKEIGVDTIRVGEVDVGYREPLSCYTAVVNHAGLPALTMPLAASGAPPPGLQLIGARWGEHRLLELGASLEASGLTATPPPPRPGPTVTEVA